MRNFPFNTRRRATAVTVACCLTLGLSTIPWASADHLDDRKKHVEQKLDQADKSVDQSSAALEAATAALQRAEADLVAAQAYLAKTRGELAAAEALDRQMQAKLDAAVARLKEAREELEQGRRDIVEQEEVVSRLVAETYEAGSPALMGLSVVLTSQDPAQLTGQLSSIDAVIEKQGTVLDRLEVAKVLLDVKEQEMEAAKIEVAKQRKAAAENLRRKQALELQAEQAEADVRSMVSLRAEARSLALKAKRADLAVLSKLQDERDRIEELLAAEAARAAASGGYNGPSTGNGFLDYPVNGPITSPYGWRTHPVWGYRSLHDGIDFGAGCGVPIRASASGTVLEEYYQSAWGNRLIMSHGVKYGVGLATIYNHMSGYAVSVGERVERGEIIGYIGNTGWSTGCHLHYTVLENGRAVDPLKWL